MTKSKFSPPNNHVHQRPERHGTPFSPKIQYFLDFFYYICYNS